MEQFPGYLSLGMSAEEYWDGDPWWAKSYRDAEKLKAEKMNRELWLQGMYFYDALCKVSPILHAFAKGGTKPNPYPEEPYALTRKEDKAREETKAEKQMREAQRYMEQFAIGYAQAQAEKAGR